MTSAINTFRSSLIDHGLVLSAPAASPLEGDAAAAARRTALTFAANIESLGYVFSTRALRELCQVPVEAQSAIYADVWPALMEASESELAYNALLHYAGDFFGFRYLPDYPEEKRPKLRQKDKKPHVLSLVTPREALSRFYDWLGSTQSWSDSQREAMAGGLRFAIEGDPKGFLDALANGIPNRENKAMLAAECLRVRQEASKDGNAALAARVDAAWPFPSTSVNDVLRTAVAFCGGDVSLASPTRFTSFPRPVRRSLLRALDAAVSATPTAEEDAFSRRETWLRLGERLHPGELAKAYPSASTLFSMVRNDKAPTSLAGRMDALLAQPASRAAVTALGALTSNRPGMLARALHRCLLWAGPHAPLLVAEFALRAEQLPTSMLLTLSEHFATQHDRTRRVVMPKGKLAKLYQTEHVPAAIGEGLSREVVEACERALEERFSRLPPLGNCYIEPGLDEVPVPFAQRSASRTLQTLPRGSRLPMDKKANVTRLFLWWKNMSAADNWESRVDIDLSCVLLDADFNRVGFCSFRELRTGGLTHSGDITSAPNGACEFIDIDHEKVQKHHPRARFAVMSINSYTNQPYSELPECFAGWMDRERPFSGRIFEAKTVRNRMDITCDANAMLPMAIDLENRQVIWMDMPYAKRASFNEVVSHSDVIGGTLDAVLAMSRASMGKLFRLHAKARGTLVDDRKKADTVFSVFPGKDAAAGVNATQAMDIMSTWMADVPTAPQAPTKTAKGPR